MTYSMVAFLDISFLINADLVTVSTFQRMRFVPSLRFFGFGVLYQNPKEGGVYHFGFDCYHQWQSECNVVLPLAGASVDAIMEADIARADIFAAKVRARYGILGRNDRDNLERWFNNYGAGDYLGRPGNVESRTVWYYNQVNDYTGFGAFATWTGVPIRVAKLSNFMAGYATERIGVSSPVQLAMQLRGTSNDESANISWAAGEAIANNPAVYHVAVSNMVRNAWGISDEKTQMVWPNFAPADNFLHPNLVRPWNNTFTSSGFLYMINP